MRFTQPEYTVSEDDETVVVCVQAIQPIAELVVVTITTRDGSALGGLCS